MDDENDNENEEDDNKDDEKVEKKQQDAHILICSQGKHSQLILLDNSKKKQDEEDAEGDNAQDKADKDKDFLEREDPEAMEDFQKEVNKEEEEQKE